MAKPTPPGGASSGTSTTTTTINAGSALVRFATPFSLGVFSAGVFGATGYSTAAAAFVPKETKALLLEIESSSGGEFKLGVPLYSGFTLNATARFQCIIFLDTTLGFNWQIFPHGGGSAFSVTLLAYILDIGAGGGGGSGPGTNTYAALLDVDVSGVADGYSQVFVASTGKYTSMAPRIINEQPSGTVDNANKNFTLSVGALSGTLYKNRQALIRGVDYTLTVPGGTAIVMTSAPRTGTQGTDQLWFVGTY